MMLLRVQEQIASQRTGVRALEATERAAPLTQKTVVADLHISGGSRNGSKLTDMGLFSPCVHLGNLGQFCRGRHLSVMTVSSTKA